MRYKDNYHTVLTLKSPVVFCFAVRTMKVFQIITLLMKLLRMPLPGSWKPRTEFPTSWKRYKGFKCKYFWRVKRRKKRSQTFVGNIFFHKNGDNYTNDCIFKLTGGFHVNNQMSKNDFFSSFREIFRHWVKKKIKIASRIF